MNLKAIFGAMALVALATSARAQSPPPWGPGALPTNENWLKFWATKSDVGTVPPGAAKSGANSDITSLNGLTGFTGSTTNARGTSGEGNYNLSLSIDGASISSPYLGFQTTINATGTTGLGRARAFQCNLNDSAALPFNATVGLDAQNVACFGRAIKTLNGSLATATFSGASITGTTLTASSVSGTPQAGMVIWGANSDVAGATTLISGSGTTWQVSINQTLPAAETINASQQMSQIWTHWGTLNDATGLPSRVSNALQFFERDIAANDRDDATARYGDDFSFKENTPVSSGGLPAEFAYMIYATGSTTNIVDKLFNPGVAYAVAAFDLRNTGNQVSTLQQTYSGGQTTVQVSNVVQFMSCGQNLHAVSIANQCPITINGNAYTVQAAAFDGAGLTTGELTLTAGIGAGDGASGNSASPSSHTIWMAAGQDIEFFNGGGKNLKYNGSAIVSSAPFGVTADGVTNFIGSGANVLNSLGFSSRSFVGYNGSNLFVQGSTGKGVTLIVNSASPGTGGIAALTADSTGGVTMPSLASTGTARGSVCITTAGLLYVKTTTGACL